MPKIWTFLTYQIDFIEKSGHMHDKTVQQNPFVPNFPIYKPLGVKYNPHSNQL